jgi:Family of unknown function (DUF6263)
MKQILFLSCMLIAIAGLSQTVNNKLNFQKGQKLEMQLDVNTTSTTSMGETVVNASFNRIFDVEDVVNGNATIEHKIKRIQFKVESMMGNQNFDSDNEKDAKGPASKPFEKSLKEKYTMTLDPTGTVLSVKQDEAPPADAKPEGDDMTSVFMSQIGAGMRMPDVGDKSLFSILPSHAVAKGEGWTDTSNNMKQVFVVSDITDKDIVIAYTSDATVHKTQKIMGMDILVNSKDATTGKITLDRKTGLLKEKTGVTDSDGTMEVMGQTIPITTKVTTNILVK